MNRSRNENDPPKRAVLSELIRLACELVKLATGETRGSHLNEVRLAASAGGGGIEPQAAMNRSVHFSGDCHTSWLHPPHDEAQDDHQDWLDLHERARRLFDEMGKDPS
jgi:hypothetical protein